MKSILIKAGEYREIDSRKFYAFVDCVIDEISPRILVSDYEKYRKEPRNQRNNTVEIIEVPFKVYLNGDVVSRTELQILSNYHYSINYAEKIVAAVYYDLYKPEFWIIFTDYTYYCKMLEDDYDGRVETMRHITINILRQCNLIPIEYEEIIKQEYAKKSEIEKASEKFNKITRLEELARELGKTIV
jgi:hypothetical protein